MKSIKWENSNVARASAELDDALDKIFEQADLAMSQLGMRSPAGKAAGRKLSSPGRPRSRRESHLPPAEVLPDDFDSPLPADQLDEWTPLDGKGRSGLKEGSAKPSARRGAGPTRPVSAESAWDTADHSEAEDPEMIYDVSIVDEELLLEEDERPPQAIDLSVTASFADDQEPPGLDILNDAAAPPEARPLMEAPPSSLRPAGEAGRYQARSLAEAPEELEIITPISTSVAWPADTDRAEQIGKTVADLSPAELTRLIERAVARGVRVALKKAGA